MWGIKDGEEFDVVRGFGLSGWKDGGVVIDTGWVWWLGV